ncbi:prepilin-type N-terminal cleavage/methylation domain-containing protein [Caloramator sp. mosi_1]|uniref:prepilin-type N-terminal cleavage/methylation domain-containing protein n=1 Tax=Caloramator sp. mosi_1 TaxID=3023090 RepID=UPI00235F2410|nr:prepilin-type N-terminal cleavage/methylation domain-containing protein [Caloramator sp. mosi_1]WDC83774.1 prepilin-type N-terminal cleavage/methylation domain-containing protein [Caloramator sp. mosi_1]
MVYITILKKGYIEKRGYTLIEIICTIAIIVISLSIISLDIDSFNRKFLDSTIDTIIADMQEAKMLAINSRVDEVKVYFTLDEAMHDYNGYEVYIGGQNGKVLKKEN